MTIFRKPAAPRIIPQGEYADPGLEELPAAQPEPKEGARFMGVLKRYSRRKSASPRISAFDSTRAIYQDAIAMGATSASIRGWVLFFAGLSLAIALFAVPFGVWAVYGVGRDLWIGEADFDIVIFIASFVVMPFAILFGLWCVRYCLFLIKLDLFGVEDMPTIFDRKNKKVYILLPSPSSLKGLFYWWENPVRMDAAEFDWNCVTGEHRVETTYTGATVRRNHSFVLVVRERGGLNEQGQPKEGEPGRMLAEIPLGAGNFHSEATTPMFWEYIRRYMEEGGPALPQGEVLQLHQRPRSLWQSLGAVGPFGPRFMWWWRTNSLPLIIILISFPISLPMFLCVGICNRISHLTMRKTLWPQELHERLGEPLQSSYE